VAAYWDTFFGTYSTWQALARASVAEIETTLRPIGLSKQRAPRLRALAGALAKRRGRFPSDQAVIAELPGVGQYVASAIMLFCHGKAAPLVDVNSARVIERVFGTRRLADIRYDKYLQTLATELVRSRRAEAVNWAMLDLAALVCKPRNPYCDICPLLHMCRYYRSAVRGSPHLTSRA
jgi:A/G-specific adenine glycosylase